VVAIQSSVIGLRYLQYCKIEKLAINPLITREPPDAVSVSRYRLVCRITNREWAVVQQESSYQNRVGCVNEQFTHLQILCSVFFKPASGGVSLG